MLKLMDLDTKLANVDPVTSSEFFSGKTTNFHPEGLFSETIFGPLETDDRREKFSYIELSCKILHPAMRPILRRLDRKLIDAFSGEKKFILNSDGKLEEDPAGDIYGITKIIEIFDKIQFQARDSKERADLIKMVEFYKKKGMLFIENCFIIPPAFRDLLINDDGEVTYEAINDHYVKIIRLSSQIKSITAGSVFDYLSYRMYLLVVDMYEYITGKISQKSGLIRNNILGKRIDFSARAVISGAASEIRPDEIGVPFKILVKIFEPFILHQIFNTGLTELGELETELEAHNGQKLSHSSIQKLFLGIYQHDELPPRLEEIIKEATARAIKGKVVVAKRDPSLHAESVQAFKPVMLEGNVAKLHPSKCGSFNADFDGDQMALYVPVTKQAIEEAKEKMVISTSKDGMGQVGDSLDKDLSIGVFIMTKDPVKKIFKSVKRIEDVAKMDINEPIKWGSINTTVGRVLFNQALPTNYPFVNESVDKKKLNNLAADIYNNYSKEEYVHYVDVASKLGFRVNTTHSPSFSLSDLMDIPQSILALKTKLKNADSETADKIIRQMTEMLQEHLEKRMGNLGIIGKSGNLKGGYAQSRQILIAKGLISDNEGKILEPIAESYAEGMQSKDFFMSGAGSRKGIADRVLNTADTGYISRQLVYALQRVEVKTTIADCGTKRGWEFKCVPAMAKRMEGRYVFGDKDRVRPFDIKKDVNQIVKLKSPIFCQNAKICRTCYGELGVRNNTPYVGILAGQILGEVLSQTIMKSFHSGGSVSVETVNIINEAISQYSPDMGREFQKQFAQQENSLISKNSGKIIVNKSYFLLPNKDIQVRDNTVFLEYGYFKIELDNGLEFDFVLDYKTEIPLQGKQFQQGDQGLVVKFQPGSVFTCPSYSGGFHDAVKIINHTLSGKKPWKSAHHFALKIYGIYYDLTGCDLVHMEVLTSNLLRDSSNPTYPARLNQKNYKPLVGNLKNIPALESYLSSLSFENVNKSISNGLVYDRNKNQSVLEDIVTGDL